MCTIDLRTVSKDDPSYVPQLERKSIRIGEQERYYYLFIGQAYVTAIPVVFQFAPDGMPVERFAEESGWMDAARKDKFVVIFPEPVNGKWDLDGESDLVFWEKLRNVSDIRYKAHNTRQYIGGYAEGAMMAELAVLRTPEFVGGMALVNPWELGKEVLERHGAQLSTEYKKYLPAFEGREPIYSRDVEQNVLIFKADGQKLEDTIAFWKSVGSGKNPWAGIHIVEYENEKPDNRSLSESIYEGFFNRTRRYRIAPNGELREASDYRDNPNAKRFYEPMAGRKREWIEVLPSDFSAEKTYPLVIALHGSNNDAPQFYDITRLWEVAEERKFICLLPTASRTADKYDYWNFNKDTALDNGNPDEEFLLELIARYKKDYPVDATRIYLTGFSNGGGMTQAMGMKHADIFAAIMPYSGACKNPDVFPEITDQSLFMPVWMNKGTLEAYTSSLSIYSHGKENWEYWVKRNQVDESSYVLIDEERQETRIFAGPVECRFSMRKDAHHAIFSEHFWSIYDDFFCRFQRGADGSSIENGYTHLIRINGRNVKLHNSKRIDGVIYIDKEEAVRLAGEIDPDACREQKQIEGKTYLCIK